MIMKIRAEMPSAIAAGITISRPTTKVTMLNTVPMAVNVDRALNVATAVFVEVPQDVVEARSTGLGDTDPQVVGEGVTTAVGEESTEKEYVMVEV